MHGALIAEELVGGWNTAAARQFFRFWIIGCRHKA